MLSPLPELVLDGIDWVILGPETGPKKRPFNPQWAIDIKAQCGSAGVAYFDKRDDYADWRAFPDGRPK